MKSSDHGYFAALTYDLRVRERLIAAGVVTQADIDRYLSEIPELETQAENLGISQPALGGPGGAAAVAAAAPLLSAPSANVSSVSSSSSSVVEGDAETNDNDNDSDNDNDNDNEDGSP